VHVAYVPAPAGVSSLHWNVEPASVEVKANDCDVVFVSPATPSVIVVSGATESTVNDRVAGVASVLPAGSMARTENV